MSLEEAAECWFILGAVAHLRRDDSHAFPIHQLDVIELERADGLKVSLAAGWVVGRK